MYAACITIGDDDDGYNVVVLLATDCLILCPNCMKKNSYLAANIIDCGSCIQSMASKFKFSSSKVTITLC